MAFLDYSGLSHFLDKIKSLFVTGPVASTDAHIATFDGTTGKKVKDSGYTIATSVPANALSTDTNTWRPVSDSVSSTSSSDAASSKAVKTAYDLAASKTSNTGTVTSVATGVGLTGGSVTTSGTIKAKLRSETALTNDSAAATETSGRVYPVAIDKAGYLAVNVPWTDHTYTIPTKVSQLTNDSGFTTNTGTITEVQANGTSISTSGVANIPAATTSRYGVTMLSSSIGSTSTSTAATSSAIKIAYEKGADAFSSALDAHKRIIVLDPLSIPSVGNSTTISHANITSSHYLVAWNFSSSAENAPPVNLSWVTSSGSITITNNGGITSETCAPILIS